MPKYDDFLASIFWAHSSWMTLMWLVSMLVKNGGMVDFAWPAGFTAIAAFYLYIGDGLFLRKLLIAGPYLFCGLRFMFGWIMRTMAHWEDRRWELWRERWRSGQGWLGIKSVPLNFFGFYHAQSLANIFFFRVPLALSCFNRTPHLHPIEIAAIFLWLLSFILENVADFQLNAFKASRANRGKVCQSGLWRYSRHPNYFFELLLQTSYAIFALPSARSWTDYMLLACIPVLSYWFLVMFTGVLITEAASLKHRGEEYRRYQESVSMLVPWFNRSKTL